jgi:hypothetical protein
MKTFIYVDRVLPTAHKLLVNNNNINKLIEDYHLIKK